MSTHETVNKPISLPGRLRRQEITLARISHHRAQGQAAGSVRPGESVSYQLSLEFSAANINPLRRSLRSLNEFTTNG